MQDAVNNCSKRWDSMKAEPEPSTASHQEQAFKDRVKGIANTYSEAMKI